MWKRSCHSLNAQQSYRVFAVNPTVLNNRETRSVRWIANFVKWDNLRISDLSLKILNREIGVCLRSMAVSMVK